MYQLPRNGDAPAADLRRTPVVVNGVMYITSPDKVWAMDARTGRELWAYTWASKGGIHLGNRGVAHLQETRCISRRRIAILSR